MNQHAATSAGRAGLPRGIWALGFVSMLMDISSEMIHALLPAYLVLLGASALFGALLQTGLTWLSERATQPPLLAATRGASAAQQYADAAMRDAEAIESMGMLDAIHRRWSVKQREFLRLQAQASDAAGG